MHPYHPHQSLPSTPHIHASHPHPSQCTPPIHTPPTITQTLPKCIRRRMAEETHVFTEDAPRYLKSGAGLKA